MDGDPRTGLLERERELAAIARLCATARDGAGRVVLFEGPAGIGKSRLLAAGRAAAGAGGVRVLSARASGLQARFRFRVARPLFQPGPPGARPNQRARPPSGAAPPPRARPVRA